MNYNLKNVFLDLHQYYYPFNQLSEKRAKEAADMTRFFQLKKGERVNLVTENEHERLYVVTGSVRIADRTGDNTDVSAQICREKPFQLAGEFANPTIVALEDSLIGVVDMETVEYLIFWDGVVSSVDSADEGLRARMDKMRGSSAFSQLPPDKVEEAFRRMKAIRFKRGDTVFSEGDPGDSFYVIESGRAEVWRKGEKGEQRKIAELGEGRSFGEEAIFTGEKRGATIKMADDGDLLVLSKDDFKELYATGLVRMVGPDEAKTMLEQGAQPLDVRYAKEFEKGHIPGAVSIPLAMLRRSITTLYDRKKYIVCCSDGKMSAAAALILTQRGFDAIVLEGGMKKWSLETETGA